MNSFAGDPVKDDLAKLHGTWVGVKAIKDGKEFPDIAKDLMLTQLVFTGKKLVVHNKGKGTTEETTFTIDPSRNPKAIDVAEGKKKIIVPGIYHIEGDTLKLVFAGFGTRVKGGEEETVIGPRPTGFDGKGQELCVVFKRLPK